VGKIGVDTVKIGLPIPEHEVNFFYHNLDHLIKLTAGGETEFQFTTMSLLGSYDNKISIKTNLTQREIINNEVYVIVFIEYSVSKFFKGHNLDNDINDPKYILKSLVQIIKMLGLKYPYYKLKNAKLYRLDLAQVFKVNFEPKKYIADMSNRNIKKMKKSVYSNYETLYYTSSTFTLKLYNKHEEFKKHDYKRLEKIEYKKTGKKEEIDKLLIKSKDLIRLELEIRSRTIRNQDKEKNLIKLLKEWDKMILYFEDYKNRLINSETVKIKVSLDEVKKYCYDTFPRRQANTVIQHFIRFASTDTSQLEFEYSKTTYYRYSKLFKEHGLVPELNNEFGIKDKKNIDSEIYNLNNYVV